MSESSSSTIHPMRRFRYEPALYLLAFIIALALRVAKLGAAPLTDTEARWALQSLGVSQGSGPALGSQPAYILLTSIFFYLLGAGTNFLARFIPALAGSALVFVPRLFQHRLKPRPSLILAFLLALDPGLVALSRQAGSSILAVTFALLAWGLWENRRVAWAGVFAGLALLSGPWVWAGLITLGLTWAVSQALELRWRSAEVPDTVRTAPGARLTALWFAVGTIILGGTLFFLAPNGLSAWVSALPDYITGWTRPSDIPLGLMLFSLFAYQPLGLILALVATLRGWIQGSPRVMRLSLWMLVALLLALFYPARQMGDLAWMLIPLWSLAALELARAANVHPEERPEVLGVVALTVLILAFIWFNFLALIRTPGDTQQSTLRTWLLFGAFFLLFISILLVAVGWSIRSARFGAVWGLTVALGLYAFGATMGAAGLRLIPDAVDMWRPGSNMPESDLLLTTVDQVSDWSLDNINSQPVTIAGIDSPALQWLLRGHAVYLTDALDVSATPPIVITTDQNNPALAAGYRGQSFVWRARPQWAQTDLAAWVDWLGFHQVVQNPEKIIVWVRGDLFLDSGVPKP
jgi:hypothetical protein